MTVGLRAVVDLVRPDLSRAARLMWSAEPALERYRQWLSVAHDLVCATAPLLAEAAAESLRRGEHALAAYYAAQLTDETGHEEWLREDFAAAGGDPAQWTERVPAPAAARLAGAQYYWLRHAHPVALIGHIAVLEWHPPRAELAAELARRTGLPSDAFRTIARHAELDGEHGRRLDELLGALALRPAQHQLITTSAITSAEGLVALMTDIGGGNHGTAVTAGAARVQHVVRQR